MVPTAAAKPQWKAAIDFKWIRDNKDVVAANIKNRNSNANLDLVLELYEKFLKLQKVRPSFNFSCYISFIFIKKVFILLTCNGASEGPGCALLL